MPEESNFQWTVPVPCPACGYKDTPDGDGSCRRCNEDIAVTDGGAEHTARGYRIECKECGAKEYGDRDSDLEWDKRYHRMHHCPNADFKVSYE